MRITLLDRLKSVLASNRFDYWWGLFTDEEKELARMDVSQLAGVLEEAKVRSGMERKRIVAEHMLSVRLARIQSKAAWGAGALGFAGALLGAALSVALATVM